MNAALFRVERWLQEKRDPVPALVIRDSAWQAFVSQQAGVVMQICKQALSILLCVALTVPLDSCKKTQETPNGQTQQAQAQAPPATSYASPTPDQLYQLVAPIALFPDNLLAQVLAASTFPDQISAAYQWLQQNSGLKGPQLMQTVNQQPWDDSVKGLTQFPDVLQQMAGNLSWTSSLGDAYFNIPQSVMNAVQVMRQRAQQAGTLQSNQQQTISVEPQAPASAPPAEASSGQPQVTVVQPPAQTIVIQPAQPDVVYVPTYNPTTVYGAPVAAYPGYSTGAMVATSLLSFGVGIAVGAAMNNSCCGWGWNSWGAGWNNSTVVYNRNTYISNSNTFANRANYNNVNRNNYNANNINRNNANINRNNYNGNNINRNDINRNDINRNNVNPNNRANNFNNTTPNFNQNRNQTQYRNQNANNLAQQRPGTQPNFNQQNRAGNAGQSRPVANQGNLGQQRGGTQPNFNQQNRASGGAQQNQRQPQRGYGQQANRDAGNGAFSNYSQGGNARTNSARGQQSLQSGGGRTSAGSGTRTSASSGSRGNARASGGRSRR